MKSGDYYGNYGRTSRSYGAGRGNERDWRLDIVNRLDRMEAKVDRILFAMLAIGATLFAAIVASLMTAILALLQN